MSTVLGIDAGGTGTRAVVLRDGVAEQLPAGGPMNLLLHADAVQRLVALVERSGSDLVGIGMPGLRGEAHRADLAARLSAATGARVVVGNDAEAALAGAFPTGDGGVVLAGTGSIALGRRAGRTHRVGGHGFLLGDEGSGWWTGREAVRAVLAERDEGRPPGPLSVALSATFGADLDGVVARVYADPRDRSVLAGLVPVVAGCDDELARAVLGRTADALAQLAAQVRTGLSAADLPIAFVGGVFRCVPVRDRFAAETGAVAPAYPPEMAAVLMAQAAAR